MPIRIPRGEGPAGLGHAGPREFGGGTRNRTRDRRQMRMVTHWPRERGFDDLAVSTSGHQKRSQNVSRSSRLASLNFEKPLTVP